MNKTFCIHPNDLSTEFLRPIFDFIIDFENAQGVSGESSDDLFYESMTQALEDSNTKIIIFLGHGSSEKLYGNSFDILLPKEELCNYKDKTLIIFACNSSKLLENINASRGIGFGFIPSGKDDANDSPKFHHLDLSLLVQGDWEYLRKIYVTVWCRALTGLNSFNDIFSLYKRLNLFFNKAIVETLLANELKNKRLIADILFYINKEMKMFGM